MPFAFAFTFAFALPLPLPWFWRRRTDRDERSGALFSYVDLEARVGKDHPLRAIRGVVKRGVGGAFGRVLGARFAVRPSLDSARETCAGDAFA
jgi:hypothetical protein